MSYVPLKPGETIDVFYGTGYLRSKFRRRQSARKQASKQQTSNFEKEQDKIIKGP